MLLFLIVFFVPFVLDYPRSQILVLMLLLMTLLFFSLLGILLMMFFLPFFNSCVIQPILSLTLVNVDFGIKVLLVANTLTSLTNLLLVSTPSIGFTNRCWGFILWFYCYQAHSAIHWWPSFLLFCHFLSFASFFFVILLSWVCYCHFLVCFNVLRHSSNQIIKKWYVFSKNAKKRQKKTKTSKTREF